MTDTRALYVNSNRTPVDNAPHSSNPELKYGEIYYDNANILENDGEFTSLVTYPSNVRTLSVNPKSGVNLVMVNGNYYFPIGAFTENLGMTQDTVSNLRSEDDKANIIVLETIYPEDTEFVPVETATQNITELIAGAVRQNLPNYNEEVNEPVYKFNLGRYYVYDSEYVNGKTLLVNKYTGQIFTVQAFYGETYSIKDGIRINSGYAYDFLQPQQ
jgi:hypothetical protein